MAVDACLADEGIRSPGLVTQYPGLREPADRLSNVGKKIGISAERESQGCVSVREVQDFAEAQAGEMARSPIFPPLTALLVRPHYAPDVASKHGVIGSTKSVVKSYAKDGIRVKVICLGWIDTAMIERFDGPVLLDSWHISRTTIGRIGTPEEIIEALMWLRSEKASYVTGHSLIVDEGHLGKRTSGWI